MSTRNSGLKVLSNGAAHHEGEGGRGASSHGEQHHTHHIARHTGATIFADATEPDVVNPGDTIPIADPIVRSGGGGGGVPKPLPAPPSDVPVDEENGEQIA
jgi:hypothetical protein